MAGALLELEKQIPTDIAWVLRVDGHTDVRPIAAGGVFKSNWDLSAARAISVVQYLVGKGVSPQRLVAAGFGEFQPIDSGKTEDAYKPQPPHRVQADRTVSQKTSRYVPIPPPTKMRPSSCGAAPGRNTTRTSTSTLAWPGGVNAGARNSSPRPASCWRT